MLILEASAILSESNSYRNNVRLKIEIYVRTVRGNPEHPFKDQQRNDAQSDP
jgi:hypothetical protein